MTAARRSRCKLTFHPGSDSSVPDVMVSESPFVMGRAYDVDLVMTARSVSREHAKLEHVAGDWTIVDLDSSNGIAVNGKPTKQAVLADICPCINHDLNALCVMKSPHQAENVLFIGTSKVYLPLHVLAQIQVHGCREIRQNLAHAAQREEA